MALPQEWTDILNGKNTNLRLGVVQDESGRPMVTAMNADGEAKGDMLPLDQVVGQGMPNPYGGASPASTISYNEQNGTFGDSQDPAVTAYLAQHYPGMGLVHQNLGTDRFLDPGKVYDTPYGRVTAQSNVKAGEDSFLDKTINPLTLFTLAMGIPTLPGGGSGLSSLADLVTGGNAAGGAGALSSAAPAATDAAGALSSVPGAVETAGGALSGGASTIPGYGTFDPFTAGVTNSGLPAATGASAIPGSTLGTAAPFTSGLLPASSSAGTAALQAFEAGAPATGLPSTPSLPSGTAQQAAGAAGTAATAAAEGGGAAYPPLDGEGGMIPGEYGDLGGTMAPWEVALRKLFGGAGGAGGIDWGKLLAGGAGVVGSMYATDKYDKLARDAMDMMGGDTLKNARKNALTRYETNAASPSAFLEDPWVQSALDQATKARTRALSKSTPVVGNPGAETDIQRTAISSLFGNLMLPYRQQLANEAGIASAPAQAAQLATSIGAKGIDSSMQGWNSAGYGMSGVTGSGSGNSMNLNDLIAGLGKLSTNFGV